VLEEQPVKKSQVFKHWGRRSGHGAVLVGAAAELATVAGVVGAAAELTTVVVLVTKTVLVVRPTLVVVTPFETCVAVTGQMVVDV
jgi:hypothetical protein